MPGSKDALALACVLHMCPSRASVFARQQMVHDWLACIIWSQGLVLLIGARKSNISHGTSTGHVGEAGEGYPWTGAELGPGAQAC